MHKTWQDRISQDRTEYGMGTRTQTIGQKTAHLTGQDQDRIESHSTSLKPPCRLKPSLRSNFTNKNLKNWKSRIWLQKAEQINFYQKSAHHWTFLSPKESRQTRKTFFQNGRNHKNAEKKKKTKFVPKGERNAQVLHSGWNHLDLSKSSSGSPVKQWSTTNNCHPPLLWHNPCICHAEETFVPMA